MGIEAVANVWGYLFLVAAGGTLGLCALVGVCWWAIRTAYPDS
ncbi:MAG: hypothetical protein Q8O40_02615 [Chloroflexota bacterium]|nr:hypothetical protein [Chloroflexota bacterium]